jgi:two-component system sensor histidine kinase KdpD
MKPIAPYLHGSKPQHYVISALLVLAPALLCFMFREYVSYHVTAMLLLVAVSVVATLYDIYPVLLSATLSALLLNFFFLPPLFTFHIKTPEDLLLLFIFFVFAVVNAVFTVRIRREERKTRERAARRNALRLYNTLFNSLSHELKTPIATIIGAVDTMRESPLLTESNRQELLSQMDTAGQRLHRQVENLLSMSRLESGMLTLNKDWCDMAELMHAVVKQVKHKEAHKITISENHNLPLFKLDIGLIQQAVYNIVQNAVIYTPPGSEITLSARQEGSNCSITIADNGPGFPEDTVNCIFDKFYRLPDTRAGGTGLGLSIAKGFVEAHAGTITAANAETGGAVFILTFPAEANYLNKLKNE